VTQASVRSVSAAHESSITRGTHATNDLVLVFVKYGAGTVTTPTGFTIFPGSPFLHTTEGLAVFYQYAASASEGAIALAGGTDHMLGLAVAIQNAHLTQPFHAVTGWRQLGAQTSATGCPLKTLVDDILVLDVFACILDNQSGAIASGEANSDLGSLTEIFDASTLTGNGGALVGYSGTKAAPGLIGPTTIGTLTSTARSGVRIAIAPIADKVASSTVTIDGIPAANGETVRLLDLTQPEASYLCLNGTTSGGTGTFTCYSPYDDHDLQAVYEDGASYGASAVDQAV
jgi:hypothetical protein